MIDAQKRDEDLFEDERMAATVAARWAATRAQQELLDHNREAQFRWNAEARNTLDEQTQAVDGVFIVAGFRLAHIAKQRTDEYLAYLS